MLPSPVTDLKPFVPARDPELSRQFYTDLGFTINWSNDQIAELQIGFFRFLLQTFYVAEHAGNFMMSLAGRGCGCLVGAHPTTGFRQQVPGNHVQAAGDAALGDPRPLPQRPRRRSLAHHRWA
jgi:hypothetical protein